MVDGGTPPLRIVFFGTPGFAVPSLSAILKSRHPVVGVVTQPDRPRGRGHRVSQNPVKILAADHHLPVLQPEKLKDELFLDELRRWAPDLGVVAAYGKILPDAVLSLPRLCLINVHASTLPRYRGAAPIHRAVMAGDTSTGVSIMHVVKELDSGAVYAVGETPIHPDETSAGLEERLSHLGAGLLVKVVDDIAAGTARATPQDDQAVSYAPRLRKEEGNIDWRSDALSIHNLVRGLQPWPMASAFLGGRRIIVVRSRPGGRPSPGSHAAGEVVDVTSESVSVKAGDGLCVDLLSVQPEGKRVMTVREFVAGHPIQPGTRFEAPPALPG